MMRAQSGVALVTAILVVAVAVLASTALLTSSNIALRRTAALRDTEQAWMLARGVEAWIVEIIDQDDPAYDALDLDNAWAQPVDYLPVDQGFLRGRVVDQQGLFNLNNLDRRLHDPPATGNYDVYGNQFRRLVEGLARQASLTVAAPELVAAIRDWLDPDQIPTFPGVEDLEYLGLDPPYRTGNREFTAVSELRAVHGMTAELYQRLVGGCTLGDGAPPQPCVAALPLQAKPNQAPAATKINVNTAPRPVLMVLTELPDEAALDQFLAGRIQKPVKSAGDFPANDIYKTARNEEKISAQFQWSTAFFQIRGEITVGSSRVPLYSLVGRSPLRVISHSAAED